MNWLDIVIIVVIAGFAFLGFRAGIIKAVLSLAGLIIGVILAGRYYVPLSEQLAFIPQASVARVVAFAIILIGVVIIAAVLARLLKWVTVVVMPGWVNHLGGAIFGLFLAAMFCSALLAAWIKFFGLTEIVTESSLATIVLGLLPVVLALLPDEFDAIRSCIIF